jgi:hypothetical protein
MTSDSTFNSFPSSFNIVNDLLPIRAFNTSSFLQRFLFLVAFVNHETFTQILSLGRCKTIEAVEIGIVIFCDDLFNQSVFRLGDSPLAAFPNQQYKVLQEADSSPRSVPDG